MEGDIMAGEFTVWENGPVLADRLRGIGVSEGLVNEAERLEKESRVLAMIWWGVHRKLHGTAETQLAVARQAAAPSEREYLEGLANGFRKAAEEIAIECQVFLRALGHQA